MAGRKKMDIFVKSPVTEEARNLAIKVFALQKRLGISRDQMAEESGIEKTTLAALKRIWVNNSRDPKFMKVHCANALVLFWNMHLTNNGAVVIRKKNNPPSSPEDVEIPDSDVLTMLIKKVGINEARKLLTARGKEAELTAYFANLTPEQLADLV